jgi:hypothetical protein
VADDQVRRHDRFARRPGHRVVGRGGQGQQHARSPQPLSITHGARAGHHQPRRRTAEQAAHLAEAAAPGTKTRSPTR